MVKAPLSVCMISGAEASRIGRALESVAGWTSEVVVVLNEEVQDGTEEIARRFGAQVFREPWKGFRDQKNSALAKVGQDWVLNLDADEAVSAELREEIRLTLAAGSGPARFAAFSCPRLSWYCGRWIRHGDWYPDRVVRLWRRGSASWGGESVHERLEVTSPVGQLRGQLLHYTVASFNDQLQKIRAFSDMTAQVALAKGRKGTWPDLVVRPLWKFVRAYCFRLGFLDGWPGYYLAWVGAFSTLTRYAKVREAREGRGEREA